MPFSSIFPFGSTGNQYNLTIVYKNTSGEIIAPTYTAQVPYGTEYSISSPEIPGYTVNERQEVVSGSMPARDVQKTVLYTKDIVVDWDFTLKMSPGFDGATTDPIVAGKEYIVLAKFTNAGNSDIYNVQFTCELSNDVYNFDSVAPAESKQQTFSYRAADSDVLAGTITFVVSLTADTIDPDNLAITDSATFTFGVER